MKKLILSFILIISSFMIFNQNVNAFTYTINVERYRVFNFTPQAKSSIPFGGQTGNSGVYFDNLNHVITCQTSICGLEYTYDATYLSNSSSTDTMHIYAVSAQLDTSGYPVCSVTGNTISCIVNNNATILGFNLYFAMTQGNVTTIFDANLIGSATIYNIPSNTQSGIVGAINSQTQQQHQDAQDINNSINNNNIDNANSSASSWESKNASNGVITQLLTLPISLLQAIVNGIQTTCSTFNLGTLWGTSLEMPCINLSSLIGSTLFNVIDLLFSGFMIFAISKKLIKIFNDFTNLKSNQIDELYGGGSQ